MFKKVTISTNTSHKQCVGYKEKMSYQTRLHNANATDLRENGKILDLKNGYSKIIAKSIKTH